MLIIRVTFMILVLACLAGSGFSAEKPGALSRVKETILPGEKDKAPDDPLGRSTPQGTVFGFMKKAGQGDYEGALGWYSQAQALDPQINPFYLVGNRCWQQEQPAEARAWLEKALQLEPEHLQANYLMAQSLYRLGEKVQAMAFLDQAVSLPSGQPDWRWVVQLGDWRLELGDRQGALTAYRRALELRPGETTIEERIDKLAESGN